MLKAFLTSKRVSAARKAEYEWKFRDDNLWIEDKYRGFVWKVEDDGEAGFKFIQQSTNHNQPERKV